LILAQKLPTAVEGKDVTLVGTILDLPEQTIESHWGKREEVWRFDFAPTKLLFHGQDQPLPGKVRLVWYGKPSQPLQPGQEWQLTVRLKRVHPSLNPGAVDSSKFLFQQSIRATGYIRPKAEQRFLNPPSPLHLNNWRYHLAEEIRKALGKQPCTAIIMALALGEEQGISQAQWDTLQQTGTTHLVSVSGLHISFITFLFFWIAHWFWCRLSNAALWWPAPYLAAIAGLFGALIYAVLAGFSVPTQRSLLMIAVAMSGILWNRQQAMSQILATALLAVLLYDPLAVLSKGFWLSFGAVVNTGKTQWAVTLGLFPPLLFWFGNDLSLFIISIPANAIAIPWVSALTPVILLGTFIISWFPTLGGILLQWSAYTLDALWVSLDYLANYPLSIWTPQAPPPLWATVTATVGVLILLSPLPWRFPATWLGFVWFLPLFFPSLERPQPGEIWFTLLDVGQGLSTVVRTENHVLVYDAGESVVIPFLQYQGVKKIDTFLISHGDKDHSGGAWRVLKKLPVTEVLTSSPQQFSEYSNVHPCQAGQQWEWDAVKFYILYPSAQVFEKPNNLACVLKVSAVGGDILLTSDIEKRVEYYLVEHYQNTLRADILVVPHHGSRTSSTRSFIDTVTPKIALFSFGYLNSYGHPKPDIVQRYRDRGIEIFDTVRDGAIMFRLTAGGISAPRLAREEMRRYWQE
jgi:competence protein ComEC